MFASIYRFTLVFSFDFHDVSWTMAQSLTWSVVESAAGVISASLPTIAPLVVACTKHSISTARSLSKSNSQSGTAVLSRTDAQRGAFDGENEIADSAGETASHGNGRYELSKMSSGRRSGSHLKGQGWTMITTDGESETSRDSYP